MEETEDIKSARAYGREIDAVTEESEQDFLGRLFWYTFGGMIVPEDKLREHYRELDIPDKYLPPDVRQKGAWKRACKNMEEKQEEIVENNGKDKKLITEYMVRKLDPSTRHIVKEVRRTDKGRLEYTEIVGFSYDGEDDIEWETLEAEYDLAKEWYDDMMEEYEKFRNSYQSSKLRDTIREAIHDLNPISMKSSGGVYFVPEKYSALMEKFSKLLRLLDENYSNTRYRTELIQVPVVGRPNEKEMIARKIKDDTVKEANKMLDNFSEIIKEEKEINPSEFEQYNGKIEGLMERKQEYEEMLGKELNTCEEQLNIMRKQLGKISEQVKSDE